jgi:hypothetical protein
MLKMRRLATVALGVIALTLFAPGRADASAWFTYWRNGTLIHGTVQYGCSNTSCSFPSYRAGSGSGLNACQINNWIPLGRYTVRFHDDHYPGSLIQGRVWRLSDYQCANGVRRTELFVHSEETSSNGQSGCGPPGDGPFCWESTSDYYSYGCIKIARQPVIGGHSDLGRMDNYTHNFYPISWVDVYS